MRKRIGRAAGLVFLKALILVVRLMPLGAALALGRGLGTFMRVVSRKRYRVALKNLRIAYGDELTDSERERIARESFRSFGMFMIEGIKFPFLPQEQIDRLFYVSEEQLQEYWEIMSHGKGCLLITGHLGNFEIGARYVTKRGMEIIALARVARDQGTTALMLDLRRRMGIEVVTLNRSLKPVYAGLKRNANVVIICDQNANDVVVPFFGRPTGTVDGPARIALKTGAPLVFMACVREKDGRYRLFSPGHLWPDPTCDERADVERIMTEVNRNLEAMIRMYPEQWLWFHDRWKSSPAVPEANAAVSA